MARPAADRQALVDRISAIRSPVNTHGAIVATRAISQRHAGGARSAEGHGQVHASAGPGEAMRPQRFAELRAQKDPFDAICEQADQRGFDAAATTMTWADIGSHTLDDDEAIALQTPGHAADILKNHTNRSGHSQATAKDPPQSQHLSIGPSSSCDLASG